MGHRHITPKSSANPWCHVQEAFDAQYSCTLMDWPGHGPRYIIICDSHFLTGWRQQYIAAPVHLFACFHTISLERSHFRKNATLLLMSL